MGAQEVISILITLTAAASFINHRYIKLPKSIGITLITLVLSLILALGGKFGFDVDGFATNLLQGISFNETFLHGMLSFLLFAGSLHVNAMELAKHKALVALLATVSVAISTFLIGYAIFGITYLLGINLPFYFCFVFGALISPTDPIAVLGILKKVKAPKSLELKIAGEALFNDGMGIVLFFVTLGIASGMQNEWTPNSIVLYFIKQGVGGFAVGALIGWVASKLLKKTADYDVAIILTLAVVTGGYTLAHNIMHVSGPIAIAVAGLVIGSSIKHGSMSKSTIERLDAFWELLDEALNAILFVLIGLEFMRISFDLDTSIAAVGAILVTIAARFISISIPVACLGRFRKFNHDIVTMMTWGGLRGGISIALALSVSAGPNHDFIIAITYAVVIFSMMVQGLTIGPLIKRIAKKNKEAQEIKYLENMNATTNNAVN